MTYSVEDFINSRPDPDDPGGNELMGEVVGFRRGDGGGWIRLAPRLGPDKDVTETVELPTAPFDEIPRGSWVFIDLVFDKGTWMGVRIRNRGPANRFEERQKQIDEARQSNPHPPRTLGSHWRRCSRLHVLTGRGAIDCHSDIEAAIKGSHLAGAVDLHDCDLRSSSAITVALAALRLAPGDGILIARGGGDETGFDALESPKVVGALAPLARDHVVAVAVGHARDHVNLQGIVGHVFDVPYEGARRFARERPRLQPRPKMALACAAATLAGALATYAITQDPTPPPRQPETTMAGASAPSTTSSPAVPRPDAPAHPKPKPRPHPRKRKIPVPDTTLTPEALATPIEPSGPEFEQLINELTRPTTPPRELYPPRRHQL